MRICSFLASGTEIVCALGLQESLVGVSDSCDFPPQVKSKPKVVRSLLSDVRNSREIDGLVWDFSTEKRLMYEIDSKLLRELSPDLILTQDLCRVCAIPEQAVRSAIGLLPREPELISLDPHTNNQILDDIRRIGRATGRESESNRITGQMRKRIERIVSAVRGLPRPRVCCLEWIDPPIAAGHWVPEQIDWAGGYDGLVAPGAEARRVAWEDLVEYQPDVMILAPCGFITDRTEKEFLAVAGTPELRQLRAVRDMRVYAVDARSYFSRHGPRSVYGVEILAKILHPDRVPVKLPRGAFKRIG